MNLKQALITCIVLTGFAGPTLAQTVVYSPIVEAPIPSVVVRRPVLAAPSGVPLAAPLVVQRPVFSYPSTVAWPSAVVSYRPVARNVAPVVLPAPAVRTSYVPSVSIAPVATPVIVRTKVYVPGQPIRNLLKAVTP